MKIVITVLLMLGWLAIPRGAESTQEYQHLVPELKTNGNFWYTDDGRRIIRLPETDQGYRTQAFLETLVSTSRQSYQRFVTENYCVEATQPQQVEFHIDRVAQLSSLLANATVGSLQVSSTSYRLEMYPPNATSNYLVTIAFSPEADHKITGINFE